MFIRAARIALAAVIATMLVACGGNEPEPQGGPSGPSGELIVQVASYDIAVGDEGRVILGLLTPAQLFVSYGTVDVEFFYLGTEEGSGKAQPGPTTTGTFLVIPGDTEPEGAAGPIAAPASRGRGVYATEVAFDRAGFWSAQVTADVEDEGRLTGNAVFEVLKEHAIPAPGDPALKTDTLTIDSKDAPEAAVDSRAAQGDIPDPELHQMTIAETIQRGEPSLVVFATPVYCVSRFCGPITDMVADLAKKYDDRANFIHVEIWRNFEGQVVNKGAADWLLRGQDLSEPWVFLIGANGRIIARWDNVATPEEIEPLLKKLPRL